MVRSSLDDNISLLAKSARTVRKDKLAGACISRSTRGFDM